MPKAQDNTRFVNSGCSVTNEQCWADRVLLMKALTTDVAISRGLEDMGTWAADLPACVWLETGDLHAIDCASWSGDIPIWGSKLVVLAARTTSELDGQALSFEFSSVYVLGQTIKQETGDTGASYEMLQHAESVRLRKLRGSHRTLTGHYITGIHGVFIFDKSKASHELDLLDRSCAMAAEVVLDVLLGDWR